ncbi:nucleoside phosphorylase [Mesorhizobium sp. M0276]|uniref:nucleoside phosphorylase n=1 Tax=Mesorhizobium sp. M0276 TaxID=2956928 RepID=UPI0033359526
MTPPIPRSPLLELKDYSAKSVFQVENMLRETRRQKGLPLLPVPAICVLDPDGDIVRRLRREGRARPSAGWACYHTVLDEFDLDGQTVGVIGCAVGSSFAVLVAEQLFASGCRLLISITSAGQITSLGPPPYFVLIDRALRDEGTSHHYVPPAEFSEANPELVARVLPYLSNLPEPIHIGASWTTDAPFRETARAIEASRAQGIAAVEMEAAALYAFAAARSKNVICFAHVTNQMGQTEGDFEKGEADGTADALAVIAAVARGTMNFSET